MDSLADLEACEHDAEESHAKIEELVRIGEDSEWGESTACWALLMMDLDPQLVMSDCERSILKVRRRLPDFVSVESIADDD